MTDPLYQEAHRPQFHFTAAKGWLNDPNGLLYYKGRYHLFFQHNPDDLTWGNMTWGHAVSTDLVHWKQLPNAIDPEERAMIYSGSAVVDWDNTAGLRRGREKTLVAIYTAAGKKVNDVKVPDAQCIAYSNDAGTTWTKWDGNPVLAEIAPGNRDPKVFWHAPTRRWVMVLYIREMGRQARIDTLHFFTSPDLKQWEHQSKIDGYFECPDLFELGVEGARRRNEKRWVLMAADGRYQVGQFDGKRFVPDGKPAGIAGKRSADWGANFYAAQTFSDMPHKDGRRILIGWMKGAEYPDMPFNQQMTFPCELTLRAFPLEKGGRGGGSASKQAGGASRAQVIRLCKYPVRQIARLYGRKHQWRNLTLRPGQSPLADIAADLLDVEAEFEIQDAVEFGFVFRWIKGGTLKVGYIVADQQLMAMNSAAPLPPTDGRIHLRILVDRTSVEVFGDRGRVALSSCFTSKSTDRSMRTYIEQGSVKVVSMTVRELKSSWK